MNAYTSDERNITLNPTYEGPLSYDDDEMMMTIIIIIIIIIIISARSSRSIQIFRRAHKNASNENGLHNTNTTIHNVYYLKQITGQFKTA
jgi:flagellar basal body-associated protein FliL